MYKYYNANVLNNDTADCVVRAISNAEGKSWDETYEELSYLAQQNGKILDDVEFVEEYLDKKYKRTCHYSKTVGEFAKEHPRGVYLVTMQGHITSIVDGVIYDTFDCSDRPMWCAWRLIK